MARRGVKVSRVGHATWQATPWGSRGSVLLVTAATEEAAAQYALNKLRVPRVVVRRQDGHAQAWERDSERRVVVYAVLDGDDGWIKTPYGYGVDGAV